MRSINADILLRNRPVFVAARDAAFHDATRLLDEILAEVGASNNAAPASPSPRLKKMMAALVDELYYARYYARLSVGGDTANVPDVIDNYERAYIDHVETMYSYSRSINRLLRHEFLIESFVAEHPAVTDDFKAYLNEIRKSDVNLIYANLNSMRDRMKLFHRFVTRKDPKLAAAGAAARGR